MLEKRIKEVEKKISVVEQLNLSLESKVECLQGEVKELRKEKTRLESILSQFISNPSH